MFYKMNTFKTLCSSLRDKLNVNKLKIKNSSKILLLNFLVPGNLLYFCCYRFIHDNLKPN